MAPTRGQKKNQATATDDLEGIQGGVEQLSVTEPEDQQLTKTDLGTPPSSSTKRTDQQIIHSEVESLICPGLSNVQVTGLMQLVHKAIDKRLNPVIDRLEALAKGLERSAPSPNSDDLPHPEPHYRTNQRWAIEALQGNNPPDPPIVSPPLSLWPQRENQAPTKPLLAEQVGYFDPGYKKEQEMGTKTASAAVEPVVSVGKYVYYKDVYVFVDRLKDMVAIHGHNQVKNVVADCLKGDAQVWHTYELTDDTKDLLRDATTTSAWYKPLITRFKPRAATALAQLTNQSYSLATIKYTTPRSWIMQMLHWAKAAELESTYNRLVLIWNKLDVTLRRDIPEPTANTSLALFLEQIDSKTAIWYEMADRQQRSQQQRLNEQPKYQQQRPYEQRKPTPNSGTNTKLPQQVRFSDNKQAYLTEIHPDGYGFYAEEEDNQEHGPGPYTPEEDEMPVN